MMTDLFRLENEFVRPALLEFVRLEESYISSNALKATLFDTLFGIALVVVNISIYLALIRPALNSISKEFSESSDLLQLVPNRALNEATLNDVTNDLFRQTSEEDELILDFDDRNAAALSAYKARVKRRRQQKRRNRLSAIGQVHGCLRSYPLMAYLLPVCATLLIVLKAYPSSIRFSSRDIGINTALLLGALIAGTIPTDSVMIVYPLLSSDRFLARNLVVHVNTVASLATTFHIILRGDSVQWTAVIFSTIGAALAATLNFYHSVPELLQFDAVVLVLAATGCGISFGIIFVKVVFNNVPSSVPIQSTFHTKFDFALIGFIGGILSVINGTGVGILVYATVLLFFVLNDRIALNTSIIVRLTLWDPI